VYVVSKSNLYCLDAVGSGGTTTQIWKKTGIDYYSGPTAVVEDRLYFGNGRLLTCLNADTGSPIWTYNSGHPNKRFKIQPTIADNKIFTGFGTGYKMIVLDAIGTGSTTTLLWEFPLQHDIQGDVTVQPVVADGKCYLFTSRGFIYGFFDHLNPPTIEGPTEGYANTMYTFTASSQPFLEFQYLFSFGDGEDSYWIPEGSVDIGEEVTVTHSYGEPGTYDVRVKIRHEDTGLESDWSEPVSIHINRLKIMSISGGMGVTATIKNMGDYAKDVQWTIDVIGGTFPGFHINKGSEGSIEPLAAQDTAVITVPTFIGLGKFKITINAECPGESTLTETYDAKVLFFYVII